MEWKCLMKWYSGGSVLTALASIAQQKTYNLSALVRKPTQVAKLNEIGVKGLLFQSLDDETGIFEAASGSDGMFVIP
jgi:hypothetical protein